VSQCERQTHRETDTQRQTHRETDIQRDRHTERQRDRLHMIQRPVMGTVGTDMDMVSTLNLGLFVSSCHLTQSTEH
jgi:hypothetical protein